MFQLLDDDAGGPSAQGATADRLTYQVAAFDEVSTVGPQDVVITHGDEYSVRSEGSPEALGQLEVVSEDGELTIRPRNQFRVDWRSLASATFYVTVPRLEAVALAGSGDVRIDRVDGPEFSGTVAGSGELVIDEMRVDEAEFSIAGSGTLVASGAARDTRISIGGSGEVRAKGLRSETASVSIGGSGDAALTVDRQARVSIMGSGDVAIAGPARCSVSRMGSGNVRCGGDD